jgi:hypothetical protein
MGLLDTLFPGRENQRLDRERMRLSNEQSRQSLKANKRREDAMGQLSGLLAPSNAPAGNMVEATPDMQRQRMMGLLGQVAPKEVAMSLLAPPKEERAEPSIVRELRAAGIDPQSEQGRNIILKNLEGKNGNPLEQKKLELELESMLQKIRGEREDKTRQRSNLVNSFRNTVSSIRKLHDTNRKLEGSFLETGKTFPQYRAAMLSGGADLIEFFGGDSSKARQQLTEFNTFNKLASDFIIEMVDRLESSTNMQFSVLRDSAANIGVDPQTNDRIMHTTLDRLLKTFESENLELPDGERQEAYELMKVLERSSRDFGLKTSIPGFASLTKEKQEELAELLEQLTPEQRRALIGR